MFMRTFASAVALVVFLAAAGLPAQSRTFPVDELRAGMVGIGRTVFEGDRLDEFKVHIWACSVMSSAPPNLIWAARLGPSPTR